MMEVERVGGISLLADWLLSVKDSDGHITFPLPDVHTLPCVALICWHSLGFQKLWMDWLGEERSSSLWNGLGWVGLGCLLD
jgi:hypothetical protein